MSLTFPCAARKFACLRRAGTGADADADAADGLSPDVSLVDLCFGAGAGAGVGAAIAGLKTDGSTEANALAAIRADITKKRKRS